MWRVVTVRAMWQCRLASFLGEPFENRPRRRARDREVRKKRVAREADEICSTSLALLAARSKPSRLYAHRLDVVVVGGSIRHRAAHPALSNCAVSPTPMAILA